MISYPALVLYIKGTGTVIPGIPGVYSHLPMFTISKPKIGDGEPYEAVTKNSNETNPQLQQ